MRWAGSSFQAELFHDSKTLPLAGLTAPIKWDFQLLWFSFPAVNIPHGWQKAGHTLGYSQNWPNISWLGEEDKIFPNLGQSIQVTKLLLHLPPGISLGALSKWWEDAVSPPLLPLSHLGSFLAFLAVLDHL